MKRLAFVFPTAWDRRQLEACHRLWRGRFEPLLLEPSDESCPWDFDVLGLIERTVLEMAGGLEGVLSSSDYPGATAAGAIATRLGLPGPTPQAVIGCSHKYYSRLAQREAVPEATPRFALVDPVDPLGRLEGLDFPLFVKPVKGAFSLMARKVSSRDELLSFMSSAAVRDYLDRYMTIFDRLVESLSSHDLGGRWFIAEELLHGELVTVEGYALETEVEILGVVDSATEPATGSFVRFDYPSTLDRPTQERMAEIARRAVRALGLQRSLFNIEMIRDPSNGSVHIIEINPRMCGQFADLYEKVDGVNTYELAMEVAAGGQPQPRRGGGPHRVAASFPLRVFRPTRVARAPTELECREAERAMGDTLVWPECVTGQILSDFVTGEDGASYRYGVVNVGGPDRASLADRRDAVLSLLGFSLAPIVEEPVVGPARPMEPTVAREG